MRSYILVIIVLFLASDSFAHGYSTSELDEVFHKFNYIYIVEVTDIHKRVEKDKYGNIFTYFDTSFRIQKVLKGEEKKIKMATYFLPPFVYTNKYGLTMEEWLKIDGSGIETSMKIGTLYIMYFTESGMNSDDGTPMFERVDVINKKDKVKQLLSI